MTLTYSTWTYDGNIVGPDCEAKSTLYKILRVQDWKLKHICRHCVNSYVVVVVDADATFVLSRGAAPRQDLVQSRLRREASTALSHD